MSRRSFWLVLILAAGCGGSPELEGEWLCIGKRVGAEVDTEVVGSKFTFGLGMLTVYDAKGKREPQSTMTYKIIPPDKLELTPKEGKSFMMRCERAGGILNLHLSRDDGEVVISLKRL